MLPDKVEMRAPADWFLVAYDGDLVLRANRTLHIAEDANGALLLNPPEGECLVEISSLRGTLQILVVPMHQALRFRREQSRSLTFGPGDVVELSLPNCSVILTSDYNGSQLGPEPARVQLVSVAGEDRKVARSPVNWLLPTGRVAAAAQEDAVGQEPAGETGRNAAAQPLSTVDLGVPVHEPRTGERSNARRDAVPGPSPGRSAPRPSRRPRQELAGKSGTRPLGRWVVWLVALVLLALLPSLQLGEYIGVPMPDVAGSEPEETVAADARSRDRETGTVQPGLSDAGELLRSMRELRDAGSGQDEVTGQFIRSSVEAVLRSDPDNPEAIALLEDLGREPPAEARSPDAERPVTPDTVQAGQAEAGADAATRALLKTLEDARRLLEAGAIIAPAQQNAVSLLRQALRVDPGNPGALELLDRCADVLLAEARQADDLGDPFQARNLVEEVLAFHPDHSEARRLWVALTES